MEIKIRDCDGELGLGIKCWDWHYGIGIKVEIGISDLAWGLGRNLCSEGPIFRGSYVPNFCKNARNIEPSEQRAFYGS